MLFRSLPRPATKSAAAHGADVRASAPPPSPQARRRPPLHAGAAAAGRALLWTLPLLLVGVLWTRSYFTLDEWSTVDRDNVLRGAVSYRGALHLIRAGHNSTPRRLTWDTYDVPRGATLLNLYDPNALAWAKLGFVSAVWPPPVAPASLGAAPVVTPGARPSAAPTAMPSMRRSIAPWLFTPPFVAYAVPYWPLAAILAIPTARAAWRLVLRRRRARNGLCPGCGYDLRASEGACPECGEAVFARPRANAKGAARAEPPLGVKSKETETPTRP